MIKCRDSNYNWQNWSSTFSNATNQLFILTLIQELKLAGAAMWGTINSSVVNGRHSANPGNGDDMVGYFFSEVAGYMQVWVIYRQRIKSNGTFVSYRFQTSLGHE